MGTLSCKINGCETFTPKNKIKGKFYESTVIASLIRTFNDQKGVEKRR